jgi:hypothetical protein
MTESDVLRIPGPDKRTDLWRLLGQRQIISEICQWHLAQIEKLQGSKDIADLVRARWHLEAAEMLNEMERMVSAECKEREAAD